MDFKRIILAGTSSMVGKTTISTGIMKALSKKYTIQPYKIGPDYIDPTYHTTATKNQSRNLDSFFMDDGQIMELFKRNSKNSNADISVIEGVRGLYEGISPYNDIGTTASISKSLNASTILIVDGRSLTRSAAAIIKGFKSFDTDVNIDGVIFNKIRGEKHYKKLKEAINYYVPDIEVIGALPRDEKLEVSQRHLGLVPTPENREKLNNDVELWGKVVEEHLDLDKIVELSNRYELEEAEANNTINTTEHTKLYELNKNKCTVGVAYDEVFNFYYWDNFKALEDNGAKIKFFSPLNDEYIPDCDVLYLGGGYPEIYANELNKNKSMMESIKNFDGKIYGECGGLMYLTNSINGIKMTGVLDCDSIMTDRVQGLSYVKATFMSDCMVGKKGAEFKAHEFHYSKLINIKEKSFAYDINRGTGIINNKDGIIKDNRILGGYAHQHCVANPYFACSLVNNI
ncbi:Ni-sirohydrochlorin a,c-diamide synthase [Methanococcus aeolicus]|uniref:Cobyrinate a,c-diamide synthase n=1 Tax=Methanococcus aeolicus (strain ATCC BAA-1280 / DSM 17508 / OCM 812 / Nankai-3) TaxID=419665 RepID=A6UTS5_META3|nr:Ni-sirohydrochlorin a,c-diamide synthase [Methanococcus aeolicus]ABR55897.1 cobyrinic acid a,c-diamide synthase [Methanococcus aeolicus Nankai-3]UXM83998.1 Ni-sirohydrochlorin a,c-diamide synthase [Methanococcus aeolicus]